ncbi:hypothetical protein DL93DRAFT_2227327 [Clavulina sp. PMI_390]|nr:hypothetical protein DL93DRAFT_2227327 [Clavulina sp. PMI_390]
MVHVCRSLRLLGAVLVHLSSLAAAAVSKVPLPSVFELICPRNGSVPLDSKASFGWAFPETGLSGAYFNGSMYLILPSGNTTGAAWASDYNATTVGTSPMDCSHVDASLLFSYDPMYKAGGGVGTYTVVWNFTYIFPASLNVTGDSVTCMGIGPSESYVETLQFTVVGNMSVNTKTTSEFSTQTITGVLGPSSVTGTVYAPSSSSKKYRYFSGSSLALAILWLAVAQVLVTL